MSTVHSFLFSLVGNFFSFFKMRLQIYVLVCNARFSFFILHLIINRFIDPKNKWFCVKKYFHPQIYNFLTLQLFSSNYNHNNMIDLNFFNGMMFWFIFQIFMDMFYDSAFEYQTIYNIFGRHRNTFKFFVSNLWNQTQNPMVSGLPINLWFDTTLSPFPCYSGRHVAATHYLLM